MISTEYIGTDDKITIKDKYGYYYSVSFYSLRKYKPLIVFKSNPYSIQNIKLWCKLNNKSFELLSNKYKKNDIKLKWKCLKDDCGEIFEMNWDCISQNQECPFCASKQVGLSNCLAIKRPDLIKEWHPTLNGNLTPWNVTVNSKKEVWWQCDKGHEWQLGVSERNKNCGCPYCFHRLASEDYNLLLINPELCEEWDYNKNNKNPENYTPYSHEEVWWVCKECGHKWKASILNRNNGTGCPKCNESKGEKQLDIMLTKHNIPHNSQYTFDDLRGTGNGLLKFDVPVFWDTKQTQLRMLIEYDGIQHFEWVKGMMNEEEFKILQIHDQLKNEYCIKNNIPLLRIPYWDFDNIEQILTNYIITI